MATPAAATTRSRARRPISSAPGVAPKTRPPSNGVDCADTTLGTDALTGLVDSASGAIVAAVNDGLDLHVDKNARCGRRILQAAAAKCARLLGAESDFVRNPAKDPNGVKRATGRARAAATFTDAFDRQRRKGCPTGATADGLEALVDDLVADVVTEHDRLPQRRRRRLHHDLADRHDRVPRAGPSRRSASRARRTTSS